MTTSPDLPPLPGEDHSCAACGLSYPDIDVPGAPAMIRTVPGTLREIVALAPPAILHRRPGPGVWSVTEYAYHLRDVYVTSTIRLHRTRTEEHPVLEPMLNDLRAIRFRYNERDLTAALDELTATVAGFCDEVARTRPAELDRTASRLPGEQRTARWIIRHALHEGVHHVSDIRRVIGALT